jgi:Major Facilitator Superfamily
MAMRNPVMKRRTYIATTAVAAMLAVTFVGAILPTPLYPLFREAFGFSPVTLTLVYAVYVLGNLVALLLFGRLADQIGRRNTALPAIGFGSPPLPAPHGCSRRGRSADFRQAWQPAPPPHGSPKPMSTAAPEARRALPQPRISSAPPPVP